MFIEESLWIKKIFENLNISHIVEVLDIGSSTLQFRKQTQPHIYKNVFRPLLDKKASISYMDKKEGRGIDYVLNIESATYEQIGKNFDLVLCCSLLEHINNPEKVCSLLVSLVKQSGFLLVTVPQCYRYHPDPIDTMFRPSIKTLISMFPEMEIIKKEVVYIKEKNKYNFHKISELLRYLIPKFNWKVNCLLMRKAI
jgi:SAM-dependent methyltransferase